MKPDISCSETEGQTISDAPNENDDARRLLRIVAYSCAALFCAGFLTVSQVPGWGPRMAALWFALPLGVAALVACLRKREPAAIALVLALTWTALVSLTHTAPGLRLFGMIGQEASVLIYVGAAACWAIGRVLDEVGRRVLPWVVIAACAVSGAFGILQVILQIEGGALVLDDDRAHGLTTYSVYFGSLSAAALVLLVALDLPRRLWPAQLAGAFGFAVASGLSGSRAALGAAVLGLAYLLYRRRDLITVGAIGLLVAGNVMASWLVETFKESPDNAATTGDLSTPSVGDGGSSLQRLGESDGLSWRIDAWKAGLDAWADRPVTGWGVGNFRQAVQADVGAGFEQAAPRFDAHNIVVELLTTIGLPGLLLFVAFGFLCARTARGPLGLAAATLAWTWLLQPAGLSTLPVALLLLGAAMPPASLDVLGPVRRQHLVNTAAVVGLVALLAFATVDLAFSRAADAADRAALERLSFAYPFDPTFADAVAQSWWFEIGDRARDPGSTDRLVNEAIEESLGWSQRAINRQPDAPRWYDAFALRLAQLGRYDEATDSLHRALELQPQRAASTELLVQIGQITDATTDPP